jgi:hypothetical protein
MKQPFRVVGGTDTAPAERAKARERARPLLKYWLKKVERAIVAGDLQAIDYFTAKELTNYPSANEGRCYAGEKRIASKIGRCERSARQSLKRLKAAGLVMCRRGGPGRTASWFFTFQGVSIFDGGSPKERQGAAQDRQNIAGLDRQRTAAKPSEQDSPVERKPPPTPTAEPAEAPKGQPIEDDAVEPALDGEIITGEMTFAEFWLASGRRGDEGWARAVWRKLSSDDRFSIRQRLDRDGRLDMRRMYAGGWLRERMWEEPARARPEIVEIVTPEMVVLVARSPEWIAERERMIAAGESELVRLMDKQALWTAHRRL